MAPVFVGLDVFVVVVGSHEALITLSTLEALLACVCAHVSLQFVGARKRPAAEGPLARERTFSGVLAKVSLEVGRLAVHLAAAGHVTQVLPLLPGAVVTVGAVDAVGTAAPLAPTHGQLTLGLDQCCGDQVLLGVLTSLLRCAERGVEEGSVSWVDGRQR